MYLKLMGAILILAGCGGYGIMMAMNHRKEVAALHQLAKVMEEMICELEYRLTPLPELCRKVAAQRTGFTGQLFANLAKELDAQVSPDVQYCLAAAASKSGTISGRLEEAICILGASLGRFDLQGQLLGLETVRTYCRTELEQMKSGRDTRLRSYQTLGLCAGAALAILLV